MLPGIEMDVVALDDPKKIFAAGRGREIRIKGAECPKGLLEQPQETAEMLSRRPFP